MGTSTMGGDLHSDKQDKLLKLQARKKELELMLAAKNEELYKLCVREVRLTGVVPPEAPLERRPRVLRRPDTGSNFFPSPPRERPDTFSLRSARPAPEPPRRPPARPLAPPHAHAHFSSSHPDLAHCAPAPPAPPALLYQYAAQLRAHSQHLRAQPARRGALQRTQTYHLTAHSDYMPPQPPQPPQPPRTLPLRVATDDADALSVTRFSPLSPLSPLSPPSPLSPLTPPDGRPKEKQWYETSLDAPPRADSALRKSASLKRAPGAPAAQPYELAGSAGRHAALRSPAARSPDAPGNVTVIEHGKCIPYREETKPFEMSDFYKYSTKFRQASAPRPAPPTPPAHPAAPYDRLPPFSPDHWRGYAN